MADNQFSLSRIIGKKIEVVIQGCQIVTLFAVLQLSILCAKEARYVGLKKLNGSEFSSNDSIKLMTYDLLVMPQFVIDQILK